MAYRTISTDRILERAAAAPGTGIVNLGGAITGYRTFASVLAAGDTCAYFIEGVDANGYPTGLWERGFGTFASTPTLARTFVVDGSSGLGVAVNFTGTVRVGVAPMSDTVLAYPLPGGRRTVSSTLPVADGSSSSVYYLPYLHDRCPVFDGAGMRIVQIPAGLSQSLTGIASGTACDIFGYASGDNLALDPPLAWTNSTARATNLAYANGFLVKGGDATRRYLGSFILGTTGTLFDSLPSGTTGQGSKRQLWNNYNRVPRSLYMVDSTGTNWTYATGAWRIIRGQAWPLECVELFIGWQEEPIQLVGTLPFNMPSATSIYVGIALDGNANPLVQANTYNSIAGQCQESVVVSWSGFVGIGYHYFSLYEYVTNGTATIGANSGGSVGMYGIVRA
jgi:hypothetical protein